MEGRGQQEQRASKRQRGREVSRDSESSRADRAAGAERADRTETERTGTVMARCGDNHTSKRKEIGANIIRKFLKGHEWSMLWTNYEQAVKTSE